MRTRKILFALEVFIVFTSLTLYLWRTIETKESQKQFQSAEISANQLKNGIEAFVNEKISILLQVRNFWLNSLAVSHEQFLSFCREIISQIPGFQAIEYGDKNNKVVWIEPFVTSEPVDHINVSSESVRYAMLRQAIQKKTVEVTPTFDLAQGGKGFIAIIPIFRNGEYEGAIYGVFKIDTLFSLLFDSVLKQQYRCAVYDGDTLVYSTDSSAPSDWTKSQIYVRKTVEMRDHNWDLVLWPKDSGPQRGYWGVTVLLLGLALSSVLGFLIWQASTRGEQSDVTAALLEASHNLSSTDELSSILRVTGDTCLRLSGVDRCCIFLCNESDKQWEPAWISSDREQDLRWFQSLRLKYGDMPVFNRLIEDKRSLVPRADSALPLLDSSLAKAFDIGSLFIVPLLFKGKITGILTLDRIGKKHRFSPREQALIEGVASQAATAVENTKLTAEAQKQAQSVAKKIRDLESLVFIVSHDLKSPLLALGGMTSLLSEEYGDLIPEDGKQCLGRMKSNIAQMEALIKDLLEYSRIGHDETPIEKIDVEELLREVLDNFREPMSCSKVQIVNKNQVGRLCYNRNGLKHIFTNLIDNAIKFSGSQKNCQVTVGLEEQEQQFRFYVKDNGLGIDEKDHRCIFDPFYRPPELKDMNGTGVGLGIVRRVLETYGGEVWLESERGKGATFYFSIPKRREVT